MNRSQRPEMAGSLWQRMQPPEVLQCAAFVKEAFSVEDRVALARRVAETDLKEVLTGSGHPLPNSTQAFSAVNPLRFLRRTAERHRCLDRMSPCVSQPLATLLTFRSKTVYHRVPHSLTREHQNCLGIGPYSRSVAALERTSMYRKSCSDYRYRQLPYS